MSLTYLFSSAASRPAPSAFLDHLSNFSGIQAFLIPAIQDRIALLKQSLNFIGCVGRPTYTMITKSLTDRWIPLSELGMHQTAQVMELDGDEACRHRVEEMGLRPGSAIQMLRCDSPHIIAIDGRRVSFRFSDCVQVWVKPHLNYESLLSEER